MKNLESFGQFALACVIFALVIFECIVAVREQWVTGIVGYGVCAFALGLTGGMVRLCWKDMKEEEA